MSGGQHPRQQGSTHSAVLRAASRVVGIGLEPNGGWQGEEGREIQDRTWATQAWPLSTQRPHLCLPGGLYLRNRSQAASEQGPQIEGHGPQRPALKTAFQAL